MKKERAYELFIIFFVLFYGILSSASVIPESQISPGQNYLEQFTFDEQNRNDRKENQSIFESIKKGINLPKSFRPDSQEQFEILVYLVPASSVIVYRTTDEFDNLLYFSEEKQFIRFYVHPVSQDAFAPYLNDTTQEPGWKGTPTSSYRTLLVWRTGDAGEQTSIQSIKLSLDSKIGAVSRMLSRSQIERATAVSYLLKQSDLSEFSKNGIFFIDEPVSVFLNEFQFGFSFRKMPSLPKGTRLVPLFSLYSRRNRGESELQSMIDKSGMTGRQFVLEKLIQPLISQVFYLGFEHGLIGVPHEQNILTEVVRGKLTGRFHYRDLGSFSINPFIREAQGRASNSIPFLNGRKDKSSQSFEIVQNVQDYLLGSQFYALRHSLRAEEKVTASWVEKEVFRLVQSEIYKYTRTHVSTWSTAKAAATRFLRQQAQVKRPVNSSKKAITCSSLF